ncbi:MAG: GAF domain-containing protein [Chitinispirillaceae bacterium]|nr:GAF domain-containing protein [Chitinispirillaceae bacterium]
MSSFIVIVGPAPENDAALIGAAAKKFDAAVAAYSRAGDSAVSKGVDGFISFLPCAGQGTQELIGMAKRDRTAGMPVPLFQLVDGTEAPSDLDASAIAGIFTSPLSSPMAWTMVHYLVQNTQIAAGVLQMAGEVGYYRRQKNRLVEIGTALSRESDLDRLLEVMLSVSRSATSAEAGNIYLRERQAAGEPLLDELLCKGSQNDAVDLGRTREFRVPLSRGTIAGYVAVTGKPLLIPAIDAVDARAPYRAATEYRIKPGYTVVSMLTVPLKNQNGEVVGVLQLMNKKTDGRSSAAFNADDVEFMESMAAQAAVSIERARLYENIRELFEGFLRSSIAAIDERDRTTSGHSKRVMGYAMAFAEAAGAEGSSPFAEIASTPERKRQFQFAALLHDIGKIGVPEKILTKEGRLQQDEFALIAARFDLVLFQLTHAPGGVSWKSVNEVADDRRFLERVNTVPRLRDEDLERLARLRGKQYTASDGRKTGFLSDHEFEALSVLTGNLTEAEREVIQSHALSTYRILSKIPWTRQFEMIPVIAATHHERVDGSGYPHGLRGDDMTVESRILAVIDVYDALVAQDRPYKPKLPSEKALEIIYKEAEAGHLDKEVVRFFVDKEIYRLYTGRKTK